MCHFNLHKTFSVPHGCMGGAVGGVGVTKELEPFLPTPSVEFDGSRYFVRTTGRESIGTLRAWYGNVHSILKAYAWITTMGADGLRAAAEAAVLNNNYLVKRVTSIPGASIAFGDTNDDRRLDQARYSWEQLTDDTGVTTSQIHDRVIDFGVQSYFTSHHPWLVPEPFSLEPAESYSVEDLDEYAAVLGHIAAEAHDDPDVIRTAPHHSTTAPIKAASYEHPYMTWQAYANRDADPRPVRTDVRLGRDGRTPGRGGQSDRRNGRTDRPQGVGRVDGLGPGAVSARSPGQATERPWRSSSCGGSADRRC